MSSEQRNINDLLALAKDYASRDLDLYAILTVAHDAPEKEIHRGWRRQNLLHHPDKTREAFDPGMYELIGNSRDVLMEPASRAAYDAARGAAARKREERERMDREKRRYVDELEAAEKLARLKKEEEAERLRELERERERMRAEGAKRREEEDRKAEEERERERLAPSLEEREADILKRIEEKARRRAERAGRKAERAAARGAEGKVSAYYFSTDPALTYEEKVAGVMGKLRARQAEREERRGGAAAAAAAV